MNTPSPLFICVGGIVCATLAAPAPQANAAILLKTPSKCVSLTSADVDGDGRADLLGLCEGTGVVLYRNLGHGRFQEAQTVFKAPNIKSFDTPDLDGDGDADLAVLLWNNVPKGAKGPKSTLIFERNITQADRPKPVREKFATRIYVFGSTDLDGDGDDDIIAVVLVDPLHLGWRLTIQNGNIVDRSPLGVPPLDPMSKKPNDPEHFAPMNRMMNTMFAHIDRMAVADFTGDGMPDALVYGRDSHDVFPLITDATGRYSFAEKFKAHPKSNIDDVNIIDLNGDGILDIVCSPRHFGKGLGVRLGVGGGAFGELHMIAPEGWFTSVAVGDVDGDDRPDLIVGKLDDMAFAAFLRNMGNGQFAKPVKIGLLQPVLRPGGPVELGRFDADDDLDVAIVVDSGNLVDIMFNTGNGRFASTPDRAKNNQPPF